MNGYSKKMFGDHPQIKIDKNFFDSAIKDDYCFAENVDLGSYEIRMEKIILYKCNRTYLSDLKSRFFCLASWKLVQLEDFQGNTHKK